MKLLTALFIIISLNTFAQSKKIQDSIVAEGKQLYRSEMASWYGTDLFLEKHTDQTDIGGYFSYTDKTSSKCIFFSKSDNPEVIGTIYFDSTYNTATAKIELTVRAFSAVEKDLYTIRKAAFDIIDTDTLFKSYKNTNYNLVPLISNNEKKVYVLTGTSNTGVVIFGNDYLLQFDKNNKVINKRSLHANIMPINFDDTQEGIEGTIHSHIPETGDYITATDICTLMLYEKFAKWKQHTVVSANYLNIWNCITDELIVVPLNAMKAIKNMDKDTEKMAIAATFIKENNIKLNTVTPPKGFKVFYNCDSLLFMKGNFGDTIKIWTQGISAPQELDEFKKTLADKNFGITTFAKEIYGDGRVTVENYHQTEFIYRNDSLFEIINVAEFPTDKWMANLTALMDSSINQQTFDLMQDSIDKEFEKNSKFVPKLIFSKNMFKGNTKKVKLSKNVNPIEDNIVLEKKWKNKGIECYTIRINNNDKNDTETSYSYSFDENMRFVLWEGCDN